MKFRGLFVGIDRYASPGVNWLSCACRDAVALHALFSDSLGSGARLLLDQQATRPAIEREFQELARCAEEDVVVLAFSGHGTQTHELVTYDADLENLATSCVPLQLLGEWFSRIPAKRLVCFLDCCFSGGLGAKVLQVDAIPRTLASAELLLSKLSGDGRIVFTASTATQPAWESSKLRHGLLTWHLLEALQGAEEVRNGATISVYRLLEHVIHRVEAAALQIGKQQTPTLRGQIDGSLAWPVFKPGRRYHEAFPERATLPVTPDIGSLKSYGFPDELLAAWSVAIPSLNALQTDAINSFGLLESNHLMVSAPTSSGKTLIGELAALKNAIQRRRALFLLPLKALVNDKYRYFQRTYQGFGIKTIRATGEISDDIPDLMRGHYDICLLTYEKFAALVIGSPHLLEQTGTVVVDEVQMIADSSRGVTLEFIMTLLNMRRRQGIEPQVIALSAVIGATNGFEQWIGGRLLRRDERPVPLDEGILRADGSFRFIGPDGKEGFESNYSPAEFRKGSSQDWIIPLVRKLVREGKQVIVFRETRGEARGTAVYLARELGLPAAQDAIDALPSGDAGIASGALRTALTGGVAFHTSDLDRDERLVIEEAFRAPGSRLRVIAATTTLAMGINTPAEAVVIVGLAHPGSAGPTPYSIAEYKNLVGRAGRLGFVERGTSYLLASNAADEHYFWKRYVSGTPEDLHSRFLADESDPRSILLRVFAAGQYTAAQGITADEVVNFLHASFGVFEKRHTVAGWQWNRDQLLAGLGDLERHRMLKTTSDGRFQLTPLGRLAGEAGVEVESVIRIVAALSPLSPSDITDPTLIAATQLTTELDQVRVPLNRKSKYKEPQTWTSELMQNGVAGGIVGALQRWIQDSSQATMRAKRAAACLLYISDQSMSVIENALTQFGGKYDGAAGSVRSVAARTCDLLPTVARIAELLHAGLDLSERTRRLLTRLQTGVSAPLIALADQLEASLTRGDYRRLLQAGLLTFEALENTPDTILIKVLGGGGEAEGKASAIKRAVLKLREEPLPLPVPRPILPPYEA